MEQNTSEGTATIVRRRGVKEWLKAIALIAGFSIVAFLAVWLFLEIFDGTYLADLIERVPVRGLPTPP